LCALRLAQRPPVDGLRHKLRQVIILASSSRGGSSVLAEILRHCQHLLHFRAEVNPFLQLSGHGWPDSGSGSDALEADQLHDAALLEHLLAMDVGHPSSVLEGPQAERDFARELHWRLATQWPMQRFDEQWILDQTRATLAELRRDHEWQPRAFADSQLFHVHFLRRVRRKHPGVNPWYYDLRPSLIKRYCPDSAPSEAPPSPLVLEEPPYVTAVPWQSATVEELARMPLVIKTPSNVYRLGFLQRLFPRARLRVLHLTRNAAASINGLYDGWRFRGFFAHCVPVPLQLQGYSDHYPDWGDQWWKFDLPPDWERYARRSLVEVCGFQWRSAHKALLAHLERQDLDIFRLRFEDTVGAKERRRQVFEALTSWLGVPLDDPLDSLVETGLPPIMATSRPRNRRWFEKAELLDPVLADPRITDTMEHLGYATDRETWI